MNKKIKPIAIIEKPFSKTEKHPPYKDTTIIPKGLTDNDAEGFFGQDSMHWKLYREPGIMVAGVSALLSQIAHPAVAVGVFHYSEFQKDFLGRAHRTIFSMMRIWMGSQTEAIQSAKRLHQIHHHIRGTFKERKNGKIVDRAFCANDPDLLLWILATMVMATVRAYEKVYQPLTAAERNHFFEETKITAQLMGIPLAEYPTDWAAFERYYEDILAGDVLEVGEMSRSISKDLFRAYFPFSALMQAMAAGFLTEKLNQNFDLKFDKKEQRIFRRIIRFFRVTMRIIPDNWRYAPQYHRAMYRIAKANGKRPKFWQRWHTWLGKNVRIPIIYEGLHTKKKKRTCPF